MTYVTEANLTDLAAERWSDIPDPRLRQVMPALVRHLHAFVREVEPTSAEWFAAIQFLTAVGQKCDHKRQEFILCSDTLGVSMLVDAINNRLATGATPTTVEGPFHIPDSPEITHGGDMAKSAPGVPCFVTGTVRSTDGHAIADCVLDIWQTDGEGLYEAQRDTTDPWMRGFYRTGADGAYAIRTVAPIGYTIPMDGPLGELMRKTNISPMRPAHIHFHLKASGYHEVITHLFRRGDRYIETDVVFGVKEPLIVGFVERPAGKAPNGETMATPFYEVRYDFFLQRQSKAEVVGA